MTSLIRILKKGFLCSAQGSGIKTTAATHHMSTESMSNLSEPESQKKTKRELRLGDRVLVRNSPPVQYI